MTQRAINLMRIELREVTTRISTHEKDLKRRDQLIVRLAAKGVPKKDLAEDGGVSPGRVSQLLAKANA